MIILVFGVVFYRRIVTHQYDVSSKKCEELERGFDQLDVTEMDGHGRRSNAMALGSTVPQRFGSTSSIASSTRRSHVFTSRDGVHNV